MNTAQRISKIHEYYDDHVRIWRKRKLFWFIPIKCPGWWLSITEESCCWNVMLTSFKNSHHPFLGNAISADFRKDNGERYTFWGWPGVCESALTMWPVRDEQRAKNIFNYISNQVHEVYALKFVET